MSFHVGQKVCCIDASGRPGHAWNGYEPTEGAIYTIVCIGTGVYGDYTVLHFAELTSPIGYRAHRFRPIVSRKTDIAIFKRMLLPQGVDA